jgi:hypothetical protein
VPVEIEEIEDGDFIQVTLICEGCGEVIEEYEAFADRREKIENARPIHNRISCKKKAVEENSTSKTETSEEG